ncbi:MAG: peptide ABC transporter substrate-binding protein [Bdellovibrionales bacterium]|nr:peptide ABC transporter substrate-binding protein [Bdellovibrionales bacterium]
MIRSVLITSIIAMATTAAAAVAPMKVTPLGKADAKVGGTLNRNLSGEPENFNPISANDGYSRDVYENVVQGLLRVNADTYKFEPELAESYEVSKDFLTFTFKLNKNAKWADGKPVTSEDVKFSVEAIRDPAFQASHRVPYFEDVVSIETPDPHTVIFKMKKKYFKNLEVIGSAGFNPILPKHIYGDPKKKFEGAPIFGSGPYKVEVYNRGKNIQLVRNPDFWAKDMPSFNATGKFERLNFRFIKEENLQLEMAKKGQIDYVEPVRAESFEKKAVGEPFGTTVKKMQVENKRPKNYGFVAWNFKNPIFADRDTRMALSHLFNRDVLIEKFMFNKVVKGIGPVYYKSDFMPKDLKPVEFSTEKAKALLAKAGWTDKDKNGILEKTINGQPREFRFTLLLPNRDVEKYFTMYKEDLKKAGIDMEIKLIEWNTFTKLLEEQKFDAVTLSWGGGSPEDDLKQIWHSESARMGGSNFISYSNKEVDKAIDSARGEMNEAKRAKLWQKAVRLIAEDAPYTFLFNNKYDLFLLNSKVGYDKPTYNYGFSYEYWYPNSI